MEEEDEWFCGEPEAPEPEVKPKPRHKQKIRGSNNIQVGGTIRILVPIDPDCEICGESRVGKRFSVNPVKRDGYSCSRCYHTVVLPARIKAYEDGKDWPIV